MTKKITVKNETTLEKSDENLLGEIRSLIEQTRTQVAQTVNSALVLMNWHIGKRINDEILKNKRGRYERRKIIISPPTKLTTEHIFNEKKLRNKILQGIEKFLSEFDFNFIARQKRITVDGDNFYIDLLLFHRELRRLVVVELKLGKFMPADFGQIEFYLRWLDKYERKPWEDAPIGLILCSEKSSERVELLALDERGIKVSEYWTALPDKKLLEQKLHEAVRLARELAENRNND